MLEGLLVLQHAVKHDIELSFAVSKTMQEYTQVNRSAKKDASKLSMYSAQHYERYSVLVMTCMVLMPMKAPRCRGRNLHVPHLGFISKCWVCPEITAKRSSYTGDSFEFAEFYLAMISPNAVYEQQTHQSL